MDGYATCCIVVCWYVHLRLEADDTAWTDCTAQSTFSQLYVQSTIPRWCAAKPLLRAPAHGASNAVPRSCMPTACRVPIAYRARLTRSSRASSIHRATRVRTGIRALNPHAPFLSASSSPLSCWLAISQTHARYPTAARETSAHVSHCCYTRARHPIPLHPRT